MSSMIPIKNLVLLFIIVIISWTPLYSSFNLHKNNRSCHSLDCHQSSRILLTRRILQQSSHLSQEKYEDIITQIEGITQNLIESKIIMDIKTLNDLAVLFSQVKDQKINSEESYHKIKRICQQLKYLNPGIEMENILNPTFHQIEVYGLLIDYEYDLIDTNTLIQDIMNQSFDYPSEDSVNIIRIIISRLIRLHESININVLMLLCLRYIDADDDITISTPQSNSMDLHIRTGYECFYKLFKKFSFFKEKDQWLHIIFYRNIAHYSMEEISNKLDEINTQMNHYETIQSIPEYNKNLGISYQFINALSKRMFVLQDQLNFTLYHFFLSLVRKLMDKHYISSVTELVTAQSIYFNLEFLSSQKKYYNEDAQILKELKLIQEDCNQSQYSLIAVSSIHDLDKAIFLIDKVKKNYSEEENLLFIIYILQWFEKKKLVISLQYFNILKRNFLEADDALYQFSLGIIHPLDSLIVKTYIDSLQEICLSKCTEGDLNKTLQEFKIKQIRRSNMNSLEIIINDISKARSKNSKDIITETSAITKRMIVLKKGITKKILQSLSSSYIKAATLEMKKANVDYQKQILDIYINLLNLWLSIDPMDIDTEKIRNKIMEFEEGKKFLLEK